MSGSNWSVRIAVIGTLAALSITALGAGAFFGALSAPHYGYQTAHPAYRSTQTEQDNPSQIDRDRAGLPEFAERIASGPDPQDPQDREKRDLAAQESMSVWAFWLLLVSAVGVVTTMVGTGFLLWQIILTRRAVEDTGEATAAMREANRIAAHTQRPWIAISAELLNFTSGERHFTVDFRVAFENTGRMVAESFHAKVEFIAMGEQFLEIQKEWFDKFEREVEARDTVVIPGQSYNNAYQSSYAIGHLPWRDKEGQRKDCHLMVLAMARYRIPGEIRWRYAMKSFSIGEDISPVDNRHVTFRSMAYLKAEHLTVQPLGRSRAS